ncbi:hypothetical protein PEC18_19805 [Paucibacter sp. O1-1]|nr:hypothetical protein [Paucibacter sp. O1-1]MDA3828012.1 hypothetical protein [Paucibacter sp. O1-1]
MDNEFGFIKSLVGIKPFTIKQEKELVAEGEILSSKMFQAYLEEKRKLCFASCAGLYAHRCGWRPELATIEEKLVTILNQYTDKQTIITRGFICRNPREEVDNLKRGGSDYTASLIGGAIRARTRSRSGRTLTECIIMIPGS